MIRISEQDLETAEKLLLSGEVVAIPTETVYGLAASIAQEAAIRKVFSFKQRPFFDPLIVHVASLTQAKTLVTHWSPLTDFLARTFWPGALTLVLPKSSLVHSLITSGLDSVAIRFPRHEMAIEIISKVGPLAAPSANKFGKTSPTQAHHVREEFKSENIFVVDGGPCEVGIESTVLEISPDDNSISILRPGGITQSDLTQALKKWSHPVEIKKNQSQKSPGHLEHHYMPEIPLILLVKGEKIENLRLASDLKRGFELRLSEAPEQAARELYANLRSAKSGEFDFIYYAVPESYFGDSNWDAILDRLKRAAQFKSENIKRHLKTID